MADPPVPDLDALVARAERYPFARPGASYVWRATARAELEPDWRSRRQPVLAIGANASPERLRLKFEGLADAIPVERARIHGYAIVYAAHFASYGAIPATLHPDAGAVSELFVTWLSPSQLELMHRSEGVGQRYAFRTLERLVLEIDRGPEVLVAAAYVSRFGALSSGGAPIRLAAIPSSSALPGLDQRAVLEHARRRLAPELDRRAFMTRIVACFGYRTRQTLALARDALPWPEPGR